MKIHLQDARNAFRRVRERLFPRQRSLPAEFEGLIEVEGDASLSTTSAEEMVTARVCISCGEEHTRTVPVNDAFWCADCFTATIVPQFHAALKNETQYPVRTGEAILNIDEYRRFFTAEFVKKYHGKQEEYETPVRDRLYCAKKHFASDDGHFSIFRRPCGAFLGCRTRTGPNGAFCVQCAGFTCKCGGSKSSFWSHRCRKQSRDEAFVGLTRGVDYADCPNFLCGVRVELDTGCNAMICPYCRTQFCFVCGKKATHSSDHWQFQGQTGEGCPRFGRRDDRRAIWDIVGLPPPALVPIEALDQIQRAMIDENQRRIDAQHAQNAENEDDEENVENEANDENDENERLRRSEQGQLRANHQEILRDLHEQLSIVINIRYRNGRDLENIRNARRLVQLLQLGIEVYIADMRNLTAPRTPFREEMENLEVFNEITVRGARLQPSEFFNSAALFEVLETYNDAWHRTRDLFH